MRLWAFGVSLLVLASRLLADDAGFQFDKRRAEQLYEREKHGESLTAEEHAWLEKAKAEVRRRTEPRPETWTQHLTPLTELGTGNYKGESGGLYGAGKNEPPAIHLAAALKAATKIVPLDAKGQPAADGRIGLLSVGMSNTSQEFSTWVRRVREDRQVSPKVVVIDGAQGGRTSIRWADANSDVWPELDRRLAAAGITAPQVQVIWMKQAEGGPARLGEFPKHAQLLKDNLVKSLVNLHEHFPNLRLIYLSSRIYAGYATTSLNPEPYAYESAFAMRWLIQDQIAGKLPLRDLPVLLWGPYLWADGATPRKTDHLAYEPADFERDGTHPSSTGRAKVAEQLSAFFKSNVTTKPWFLANPGAKP